MPLEPLSSRQSHDSEKTVYGGSVESSGRIVGVLVGIEGKLLGKMYALHDGPNEVGRDAACHVHLPEKDMRISRRHARIVFDGDEFTIEPLQEQNPTRINGECIDEVMELVDGAAIYMGMSEFRFRKI